MPFEPCVAVAPPAVVMPLGALAVVVDVPAAVVTPVEVVVVDLTPFALMSTLLVTAPSLVPPSLAMLPQPMPSARIVRMPFTVVVVVVPSALVTVSVPPLSAVCSCSAVGLVMPARASWSWASASACFTLPQPIGLVGTVMVLSVVVPGAPPVPAVVVTSVASVPLRRAFTSASAFSSEPARSVKLEAIFVATSTCPLAGSVVVVPVVTCAVASGAIATSTAAASIRILVFMSSLRLLRRSDDLLGLQDDFGGGRAVGEQAAALAGRHLHARRVRRERFQHDVDVPVARLGADRFRRAVAFRLHHLHLHASQCALCRSLHLLAGSGECLVDHAAEMVAHARSHPDAQCREAHRRATAEAKRGQRRSRNRRHCSHRPLLMIKFRAESGQGAKTHA